MTWAERNIYKNWLSGNCRIRANFWKSVPNWNYIQSRQVRRLRGARRPLRGTFWQPRGAREPSSDGTLLKLALPTSAVFMKTIKRIAGRNDRSERWDGSLKRQLQPAADFFEPAASAGIRILLQTEIEGEKQRRNARTLSASPLQRARRRRMPPPYITVASFRERPSRSAKREKRNCVGHAPVGATTRAPVGRAPHTDTDTHTQILSRLPAFQPPRMNRTPRRQIPRCRYFRSTAFADRVGRKPEIADSH